VNDPTSGDIGRGVYPRFLSLTGRHIVGRIRNSDVACLASDVARVVRVRRVVRREKPVEWAGERWVVTRRIGGTIQYWAGPYRSNGSKWVDTLVGAYVYANERVASAAVAGCDLGRLSSRVGVAKIE